MQLAARSVNRDPDPMVTKSSNSLSNIVVVWLRTFPAAGNQHLCSAAGSHCRLEHGAWSDKLHLLTELGLCLLNGFISSQNGGTSTAPLFYRNNLLHPLLVKKKKLQASYFCAVSSFPSKRKYQKRKRKSCKTIKITKVHDCVGNATEFVSTVIFPTTHR